MGKAYEEALRHAKAIAEMQKKKRMEGKPPSCVMNNGIDLLDKHYSKLRKVLKTERTKEIRKHPERRVISLSDRHRQPIQCLETGRIFHSLKELAKFLGLTAATVSIQISKKRKLKGNLYIRISKEDEDKGNG